MAQIDFAVAFVVIFIMISYAMFFVSNSLTEDFEYFGNKKLETSAELLSKQLLGVTDGKSLVGNMKRTYILFQDVGGYVHTETVGITFENSVSNIHVYNSTLGEIESSETGSGVSFEIGFTPGMKKYVHIIYSGSSGNISYSSNITTNNITASILFEDEIKVLTQSKCNALRSISYSDAKELFGFFENFNIGGYCEYGPNPPEDASIIVRNNPMLVENNNGTIESDYVTIKVW